MGKGVPPPALIGRARKRIYGALALLLTTTLALYIALHIAGQRWAENWVPNFIAEWSGIIIAVFIVDAALEHDRRTKAELDRMPMRFSAAVGLETALQDLMCFAADTYAALGLEHEDFEEPRFNENAKGVIAHFTHQAAERQPIFHPEWLRAWCQVMLTTAQRIGNIRAKYAIGFDPWEVHAIISLEEALTEWARYPAHVVQLLDAGASHESFAVRKYRNDIERSFRVVQETFPAVADLYEAVLGRPLRAPGGDVTERSPSTFWISRLFPRLTEEVLRELYPVLRSAGLQRPW